MLAALATSCTVVGGGTVVPSSRGSESRSTAPVAGIADYKRDLEALTRHARSGLSDAEVRAIKARPLPPTPGLGLDLALLTRALAQRVHHDHLGLARTRDVALRRGTNREFVLSVLSLHASALHMAGMSKAARQAYAAAEDYMLESARRAGKPAYRSEYARSFLLDYLFAALQFGDAQLGERIVAGYVEPLLNDGVIEPEIKLIARLHLVDYRITRRTAWGGGDPLAGYKELEESISTHQDSVARTKGAMGQLARSKLMGLRIKAGHLALRANRPSLAAAQLRHIESDAATELAARFAVDELRVAIVQNSQDFERTLEAMDAMWRRAPNLATGIGVVRVGHQIGRASVLASLGRSEDAEREIDAIRIDKSHLTLIDQYAGLRTVVRAMLGREDPDFDAFSALESKYRDGGQGIDRSVIYFAARTAVFHLRGSRSGSLDDAARAVAGGRLMSRFMRLQQATGVADRSPVAPLFLRIAKEAYLLAALRALGTSGVTMDDVLDAVQLFQTSDVDRDISAAARRLHAVPGVDPVELRQLQDLQRRVVATQAALGAALLDVDVSLAETRRSVDQANAASAELDRRVSTLMRASPGIRYAFGGVEALSLREIQSRLAVDEALLTAVPMSASTLVLVITKSGVARHLAPEGRQEVSELVDRVRRSTALSPSARLLDFDVDAAQQLHRLLLGWGPQGLRGVKSMTVAASGPLGAIPFGLLVRDDGQRTASSDYRRLPWLIRSMALAHVPSISSWLALSTASDKRNPQGFIAWADPDYSGQAEPTGTPARGIRASLLLPQRLALDVTSGLPPMPVISLEPLPETRWEAQAIAQAFRAADADVLVGLAATRRSVIQRSVSGDLARRGVVLFATHGLVAFQVPGLDQPALAMAHDPSDPAGSLLTLDDVLGLRMNADWIILSACNTASAARAGDDALSGLSRGFFFAGARAMLVTHWEVDSESAAEITTRTVEAYAASSTLSRAQALQRASIALIDANGTRPLWSHPAYWAPYALVGDGRGRRQER